MKPSKYDSDEMKIIKAMQDIGRASRARIIQRASLLNPDIKEKRYFELAFQWTLEALKRNGDVVIYDGQLAYPNEYEID